MLKSPYRIGFLLFTAALLTVNVFSATLTLTKIGALDLEGNTYSEWWYTGTNPTLQGTAAVNSQVTIKVDSGTYTANSDTNGDWSYATTLAEGDYSINISQGQESYAFTLHLGQNVPSGATSGETDQSTSTVPSTGFDQFTGITLGVGIILLSTYLYVWGDGNKKHQFARRFLED